MSSSPLPHFLQYLWCALPQRIRSLIPHIEIRVIQNLEQPRHSHLGPLTKSAQTKHGDHTQRLVCGLHAPGKGRHADVTLETEPAEIIRGRGAPLSILKRPDEEKHGRVCVRPQIMHLADCRKRFNTKFGPPVGGEGQKGRQSIFPQVAQSSRCPLATPPFPSFRHSNQVRDRGTRILTQNLKTPKRTIRAETSSSQRFED